MAINTGNYGEKLYRITLGTGTIWTQSYDVYAYNEGEALDLVADYIEEQGFEGLYADHYELADLCEVDGEVDDYAETHNLTCCGNHGIYVEVIGITEIFNNELLEDLRLEQTEQM